MRRNKRGVLTASVVAVAVAALVAGTLLLQQEQARTAEARAQAATDLAAAEAQARSRLETQLYLQRIALADREWSANNLSRMEALLEQCPSDLRGWEWHYLKRLRYRTLSPLRHDSPVISLAFSRDGKLLATGTQAGVVTVWQAKTGQELRQWKAHQTNATSVVFSPDGRYLATGSQDMTVKVWDLEKVLQGEFQAPLLQWEHTCGGVECNLQPGRSAPGLRCR